MGLRILRWVVKLVLVALILVLGLSLLELVLQQLPIESATRHDLGHGLGAAILVIIAIGAPSSLIGVVVEAFLCIKRRQSSTALALPIVTLAVTGYLAAVLWGRPALPAVATLPPLPAGNGSASPSRR